MAYIELETRDGIGIIWLDQPGEKVNTLALYLVDEFTEAFNALERNGDIRGVVLISRKPDSFIAGADLEMIRSKESTDAVEDLSRRGQQLLHRVRTFPKPVVAAINGACLGGGLEVAMACHYRIVSDSPKTVLGLPEVKLGLLPGMTGSQALPRLVGIQKALDIMLTGKNVYPVPAKKMGLVDDVIHPYALLHAAIIAANRLAEKRRETPDKRSLLNKVIEGTPVTRKVVYKKAREMVMKQTRGNYPAPLKILEVVEKGMGDGLEAGLAAEARGFAELAFTPQSRQLINLFFAMTAQKKNPDAEKVRPVKRVGVLGAGFMGAGIAEVSVEKGMDVVLKDIDVQAVARGEKTIWDDFSKKVKKRALSRFERDRLSSRVLGTVDYGALRKADLVIEAVFEDLDLKRKVLAETEAHTGDHCIFASNTSSLPISDIAAEARRPELVLGMHYFSPVPKMPLLEIIITPQTADWVTATAVDVGIRQGKTVIVVKDGPGFYTTRILAPMLNEALLLLEEGGEIRHIDRAMQRFGFPVGPITLIDEVGIDVGAHVSRIMGRLFADRGVEPTDAMQRMSSEDYKGRKNGKGFYHYEGGKKKDVNQTAYKFFGGSQRREHEESEIHERLAMMMVNEAARCLEEGILFSAKDGDLGAIMGLGFPPFLGGPFRYLDSLSAPSALEVMERLEKQFGKRFAPAGIIREYAEKNRRFYGE